MFNYEKILLNEVNFINSCVMPDGAVLHRPPKPGVVDVIPVIPYEACFIGASLLGYHGVSTTVEQIIYWYINNMTTVTDASTPIWAQNTIPCFLYTVNPDRSFSVEKIDYTFLEVLKHKDDPTSPLYEMANDPVRNYLFEAYTHQIKSAGIFLTLIELYFRFLDDLKTPQAFDWAITHLADFERVAYQVLDNLLQYESGNNPTSFTRKLSFNWTGSNDSALLDNVGAYNGLKGISYIVGRAQLNGIQYAAGPIFDRAALGIQNAFAHFIVNNNFTQPLGTIFANEIRDIQPGADLTKGIKMNSVKDIENNWDVMSVQLQYNEFLAYTQAQDFLIGVLPYYNTTKLYTLLNAQIPGFSGYNNWITQPPDGSGYANNLSSESWMVAGSVALIVNDIESCVKQIIASEDEMLNGWNVMEASWKMRNLLDIIQRFNKDEDLMRSTTWDTYLQQNIPASLAPLYEVHDTAYIAPKNENSSLVMFLGDPLNINGQPTEPYQFFEWLGNANLAVLSDHGANTDKIMQYPNMASVRTFIYIPVGISDRSLGNLTDQQIMNKIDNLANRGYKGVFFDAFGTANGLTRDRQNMLIDYAHSREMQVFVNAHDADEVCNPAYDPVYNSSTAYTHLTMGDVFLIEHFGTIPHDVHHPDDQAQRASVLDSTVERAKKANMYKMIYNFEVAAISYAAMEDTPNHWVFSPDNPFENVLFDGNQVGFATRLQQYSGNYEVMQTVMNRMDEFGNKWIRNMIYWSDVEVGLLGNRDYTVYDTIVNDAIQNDLNVLFVLAYDNTLAPIAPDPQGWNIFLGAYLAFVSATVSHYKETVHTWEVWDGPNIAANWGGLQPNAIQYAELLAATYQTIKQIDPTATVVLGSIYGFSKLDLTNGGPNWNPMIDLTWLGELYALGAGKYFDILAIQPFIPMYHVMNPDGSYNEQLSWPDPVLMHYPTKTYQWQQTWAALISIMNSAGDANKPIWITSTGLPEYSNGTYAQVKHMVSHYCLDFLKFMKATPQLQKLFFYELVSEGTDTTNPSDGYGFLYPDFSIREVFLYIKNTLRGSLPPYDFDAAYALWENEIQFTYTLYLMLGLDYFHYNPYYNLTTLPVKNDGTFVNLLPIYIPLVEETELEVPAFLGDLEEPQPSYYQRNVHSGWLNVWVASGSYNSCFMPHQRPIGYHKNCPDCRAIIHNMEYGLSIDPYVVNGWGAIEIAESLGWTMMQMDMSDMVINDPNYFGGMVMTSGTQMPPMPMPMPTPTPSNNGGGNMPMPMLGMKMGDAMPMPTQSPTYTPINVLASAQPNNNVIVGDQMLQQLLTLSTEEIMNGRWCRLCGMRIL